VKGRPFCTVEITRLYGLQRANGLTGIQPAASATRAYAAHVTNPVIVGIKLLSITTDGAVLQYHYPEVLWLSWCWMRGAHRLKVISA
jgi:hypothetical protein